MTIQLSQTSKMPCKSWSLQAIVTCPGSRGKDGNLVEVCSDCYAMKGTYRFPVVKKPREINRTDWKRDNWENDMVEALLHEDFFRWFDSGDCYHPLLAEKIYSVMKRTLWCKHWLPTRSYKIARIKPWLTKMKRLPNVSVRYSSDRINRFNFRLHGSMVYDCNTKGGKRMGEQNLSVKPCRAETRNNQCGSCRACWDKSIKIIGYPIQ